MGQVARALTLLASIAWVVGGNYTLAMALAFAGMALATWAVIRRWRADG